MSKFLGYIILFSTILVTLFIGETLQDYYPNINRFIYYLLTFGVVFGCTFLYIKKRRQFYINNDWAESIPSYLGDFTLFLVFVGSLLVSLFSYGSDKLKLYIDNGTNRDVTLKIKNDGEYTIRSNDFKLVHEVKGEIEITIDGKVKKFNLDKEANWIYNIDTANSYVRNSVKYSNTFSMNEQNKRQDSYAYTLKDEFFDAKAAYIFEVPKEIVVDKKHSDDEVNVQVLLRVPK